VRNVWNAISADTVDFTTYVLLNNNYIS